ncbi:MAG: fumarate hydratase subunit beta [Clostridia bacterium]|nr:fumarate hydratase subunit beta [Clostridia bacterium]
MSEYRLTLPLTADQVKELKVGDVVYLSGRVYQATAAAHQRMLEYLKAGKELPFPTKDLGIFHCYTSWRREGEGYKLNYLGATTSASVNKYQPEVIARLGIRVVIGKGGMDAGVLKAMQENACVYLAQVGGCSALYSAGVRGIPAVYWEDLQANLVIALELDNFGPLTVGMDAHGNSIYAETEAKVRENIREAYRIIGALSA